MKTQGKGGLIMADNEARVEGEGGDLSQKEQFDRILRMCGIEQSKYVSIEELLGHRSELSPDQCVKLERIVWMMVGGAK